MTMQLNYQGAALPIAQAVAHMVDVAEAEYREQSGGAQREPWLQFLPPADLNKRSKQVWMLPNLTSFTSIYARMNRYYGHRLAGIHLVHDQQLEIEGILRGGKATAEQLSRTMDLPIRHSPTTGLRSRHPFISTSLTKLWACNWPMSWPEQRCASIETRILMRWYHPNCVRPSCGLSPKETSGPATD